MLPQTINSADTIRTTRYGRLNGNIAAFVFHSPEGVTTMYFSVCSSKIWT